MQKTERPTFSVRDDAKWRELQEKLSVNWYGESILRFAATWASKMETAIAAGETVGACAEKLACRTDEEVGGTANYVYGYAMEVLSKVWEHGDALVAAYR